MLPKSGAKHKARFGIFECPNCYTHFKTRTADVKAGKSTKCQSCSTAISKTTHGMNRQPIHALWCDMNKRCRDTSNKHYGGKGVTVCEEWRNDFIKFKDWALENGYEEGLQIDKDILCGELGIYPKIYSPKTCCFITKSENIAQSNKDRHVRYDSKTI